jgi:hypothetical protein
VAYRYLACRYMAVDRWNLSPLQSRILDHLVNGDAWLSVPVIPPLYRPLALPRSATLLCVNSGDVYLRTRRFTVILVRFRAEKSRAEKPDPHGCPTRGLGAGRASKDGTSVDRTSGPTGYLGNSQLNYPYLPSLSRSQCSTAKT